MLLGDLSQGQQRTAAGVGEHNVQSALLCLDHGEESVEIGEPGDVALNGGEVFPADLRDSIVEALLAAAGDENVGPFRDKSLGGSEADAAVAAGNKGDFFGELIGCRKCAHEVLVFLSDVRLMVLRVRTPSSAMQALSGVAYFPPAPR